VFVVNAKIIGFKRKLELYIAQVMEKDISSFPALSTFVKENELNFSDSNFTLINQ